MNMLRLLVVSFLAVNFAQARLDDTYIKRLTGEIDLAELRTLGESSPIQQLSWTERRAPGFLATPPEARRQAALSGAWSFHPVVSGVMTSAGTESRLPQAFPAERDYKAGWFITRCVLSEVATKRHVLLLNRIDMFSMVYVNGRKCRVHFGALTPFEVDVTDALVSGENVIALFVHDQSASVDEDKAYNQLGHTRLLSVYNPSGPPKSFPGGIREIPILETRSRAFVRDVHIKTSTRKKELEIDYEISAVDGLSATGGLSFQLLKWPNGDPVDLAIQPVTIGRAGPFNGSQKVTWTDPKLWSPDHPELYVLRVSLHDGTTTDTLDTRFGFREFWIEGKTFILNGTSIRLRGESYYSVIRNDRDFHREVFREHKRLFGSNACRLHAFMPPVEVIQGADEAGVLLDNQSAIWSENASYYRNGGQDFLDNIEQEFEEWARRDRNSPSAVIWDVENEMLRISYDLHLPWVEKLPAFIRKFDDTRPFNNSGQGWFSRDQDMVLPHMQEHYSRIMADWESDGFCPLIMGEFWVGGRAEQRLPHSPEFSSKAQRLVEEASVYEAQMLEMRYRGVSGVMPFRISQLAFPRHRNPDTYHFEPPDRLWIDRRPDEVIERIAKGLQPVTLFFWPRQRYAATGRADHRELVLCNDGETGNTFEISWKLPGRPTETLSVFVPASGQHRFPVAVQAAEDASEIVAKVRVGGRVVARDGLAISPVHPSMPQGSRELLVYGSEETSRALVGLGFRARTVEVIPEPGRDVLLVIPEHANVREMSASRGKLLNLLDAGGAILCLKQDQLPTWFPVRFQYWSANQTSPHTYAMMGWQGLNKDLFFAAEAPIYAPSHPVFSGIENPVLHLWNAFDGRVSDDVFARPANVGKFEPGNWIPLVGGTRREHVSLAEAFYGQGTLLACQLQIMENLGNAQAATLLVNMINHLATKTSRAISGRVALRGAIGPDEVSRYTGAARDDLLGTPGRRELMIATLGADLAEIRDWAARGGSVLVLSKDVSEALTGTATGAAGAARHFATKVADHPLLNGVSSTNFLGDGAPQIHGTFSSIPNGARVLLQGFSCDLGRLGANLTDLWDVDDAGPVMMALPHGNGELLVSTIELGRQPAAAERELLCLLLTNAGVNVPYTERKVDEVVIKKTVSLSMDGSLKDWTEDMEDRLVTQYIHAQPIHLTSESIVAGPPEFDLNLSAISYLLWDEQHLNVAGVVFSEEKTFESGLHLGSRKEYELELRYDEDVLTVAFDGDSASVEVNGKPGDGVVIQTGQMDSREMTDAAVLQFDYILKSGRIARVKSLIGESFEMKVPWSRLMSDANDESGKVLITVASRGSKLQVPFAAQPEAKESWLDVRLERTGPR